MRVKKLEKEELNKMHLVLFECPSKWKPPVSSNLEVGRFPFSDYWTSGVHVIRLGSQYEVENFGKILAQVRLNALHFVHFGCPKQWKPLASSNF